MSTTAERQGEGQAANPAGLYRHPVTGEEVIAQSTPKYGSPMADAFVRVGFQYVGEAPKGTELASDPYAAVNDVEMDDSQPSVAELEAQLAAAKAREAAEGDSDDESAKKATSKSAKKGN